MRAPTTAIVNLDVVVEDTLVRMVGSTPNPASWLGIVDVPDGQYRLAHGLLATGDDGEPAPQAATVALPAVNGFEQRLKDITLKQQDRQRIEGRGRDSGYPLPPAQTRAGAANAHGSYLGSRDVWRRSAHSDKVAEFGEVAARR